MKRIPFLFFVVVGLAAIRLFAQNPVITYSGGDKISTNATTATIQTLNLQTNNAVIINTKDVTSTGTVSCVTLIATTFTNTTGVATNGFIVSGAPLGMSGQLITNVADGVAASDAINFGQLNGAITGFVDSASVTWSVANRKGTATATASGGSGGYYACILNNPVSQTLTSTVDTAVVLTNSVLDAGSPYATNQVSSSAVGIVSSGWYTVRGYTYMTGTGLVDGQIDICTNTSVAILSQYQGATASGFTPSGSKTVYLTSGSVVCMRCTEQGTNPQLYNTQDRLKTFLEVEWRKP